MSTPDMSESFAHWLLERKSLLPIAKRAQSAYILFHNRVHADPDSLRTRKLLDRKTKVGEGTVVDPTAFISPAGVRIGRNCRIGADAIILRRSIIEDDVEVGSGSVVGSQGYVLERKKQRIVVVKHTGGVRIGKGVRIGANSCIDRATFRGRTEIGEHATVGSQVQIAHGVRTGAGCRIANHAMIAGRVRIGDGSIIEQDSSISHLVEIGQKAVIKEFAIVTKDVGDGQTVEGESR